VYEEFLGPLQEEGEDTFAQGKKNWDAAGRRGLGGEISYAKRGVPGS